jgi:U2 small nuclear ribonucleoprotein B''
MSSSAKYPVNQTLYVNNLNNTVHKNTLKEQLYYYFSQYGRILDINTSKAPGLHGQAFVIFEEISDASKALVSSQGVEILGKKMNIEYAKSKSEAAAIYDNTYVIKSRRATGTGADGKPIAEAVN